MKLIAVIVTYNRSDKLRDTLRRLLEEERFAHVVVVNNASTDDTPQVLEQFLTKNPDRLRVRQLESNTGGAGGFHEAIRYAREELRWDWCLIQDDDAWPAESAVARFSDGAYPKEVGAVAADVRMPDGSICDMNRCGWFPSMPLSHAVWSIRQNMGRMFMSDERIEAGERVAVDLASFVGLWVRRSAVQSIEPPDADWFIYGDDWDYCLRLRRAGWGILFDPDLQHIHDCGSLRKHGEPYTQLWQWYFSCRNDLELKRRHLGLIARLLVHRPLLWRRQAKRYSNPVAARDLLDLAVGDARHHDMSRTLQEVKAVYESNRESKSTRSNVSK